MGCILEIKFVQMVLLVLLVLYSFLFKRPVNRMYTYNFQIGENYYLPMTSYLENKSAPVTAPEIPGPLCFSERIAIHPLSGTSTITSDLSVETIKETRKVISNM